MSDKFDPLTSMNRRKLIQSVNLSIIYFVLVLFTFQFWASGEATFEVPALIVAAGCLANLLYIRQQGSADKAAVALIGLLFLGLTYSGYVTYGFAGPTLLLAPLIPLLSSLLINERAGWVSLGLLGLILTTFWILGANGTIPDNPYPDSLVNSSRFVVVSSLSALSTWVVLRFARMSRSLLKEIDKLSNTDFLTGIFNRRGIEQMLMREVGRARRTDSWLALIMIDVDHFKVYNDTNGHQAGDDCLIKIARVIASCVKRKTDIPGRFGGEEFVLVLPDTDFQEACNIAENIRSQILEENIPYGPDNSKPVSLTLGVVSGKGVAVESNEQLIREADNALYKGKGQGRNRVVSVFLASSKNSLLQAKMQQVNESVSLRNGTTKY